MFPFDDVIMNCHKTERNGNMFGGNGSQYRPAVYRILLDIKGLGSSRDYINYHCDQSVDNGLHLI